MFYFEFLNGKAPSVWMGPLFILLQLWLTTGKEGQEVNRPHRMGSAPRRTDISVRFASISGSIDTPAGVIMLSKEGRACGNPAEFGRYDVCL